MLLDVTALFASVHANPVTEAFGVLHAQPRVTIVVAAAPTAEQKSFQAALDGAAVRMTAAQVVARSAGQSAGRAVPGDARQDGTSDVGSSVSDPVTAPQNAAAVTSVSERVAASQLPQLRGVSLLQQLSLLSRSQLSEFADGHADVLATLSARPPAAATVAAWWAGVAASNRADLVAAAPGIIGNLEGVPYVARDQANRTYLTRVERDIRAQLRVGAGRAASDELTRRLHMLEQVRTSLASASSAAGSALTRELINLDPSGGGTAVVVSGDVMTADYVTFLVPGMFSSVDSQIGAWTVGGARIAADQQAWLDRLATPGSAPETAAVVTWFGYRTPTVADAASLAPAERARTALTASISGLRDIRGAHQPYVSIVGHSYGSTAAMLALQEGGVGVDALVVVGSPGSPARSVADLDVRGGNVWVGAADSDPIADTGLFGTSPSAPSFGAHRMGVTGATDPLTGAALSATVSHMDYFGVGTESLRNIELVGIGRGDLVLGG